MEIDLSTCKFGQKLKTKQGKIVFYGGLNDGPFVNRYPHLIFYQNGSRGSRTNDGFVYAKNRLPEDADIVEILPFEEKKETLTREEFEEIKDNPLINRYNNLPFALHADGIRLFEDSGDESFILFCHLDKDKFSSLNDGSF